MQTCEQRSLRLGERGSGRMTMMGWAGKMGLGSGRMKIVGWAFGRSTELCSLTCRRLIQSEAVCIPAE